MNLPFFGRAERPGVCELPPSFPRRKKRAARKTSRTRKIPMRLIFRRIPPPRELAPLFAFANRLPGFIGPVPQPLLIRHYSVRYYYTATGRGVKLNYAKSLFSSVAVIYCSTADRTNSAFSNCKTASSLATRKKSS